MFGMKDSKLFPLLNEWKTELLIVLFLVTVSVLVPVQYLMIGTIAVIGVYLLTSYIISGNSPPRLYYKDSPLNDYLRKNCCSLHHPYKPVFWGHNAHVQTHTGSLMSLFPEKRVRFDREYLQTNDRGIVALDWCVNIKSAVNRDSPILMIFPGISGDANSVVHVCHTAKEKGFRAVVINNRGHGGSYLSTCKLNSFGDPQDVRQSVLYVKQKFPKSKVTAVAVGTGSAVLFSYLGEYGSSCGVSAASFISPVYDISEDTINTIPKFYEILLLIGLKTILLRHAKSLSKLVDIKAALTSWNLLNFQKIVYCKLYNISSIEQYLERNDPMRDVDDISIPVLCINSSDDPVYRKENIPYDIFNFYPNMLLLETEYGGHCGFWENAKLKSWAVDVALDYISCVLRFVGHDKQSH